MDTSHRDNRSQWTLLRSCALVAALLPLAFAAGCASGGHRDGGPRWELLGERVVDWRLERDVIPVTGAEGRFTAIELRVRGNAIHIEDLKVHFGNGEVQDVAVRARIPAGGKTRVIDLRGGPRVIRKVSFVYRTAGPRPGRAVVRLWGRR